MSVPSPPSATHNETNRPLNVEEELRALYRDARDISYGLGDEKVRITAIRVAADIILRVAALSQPLAPSLLSAPEWPALRQAVVDVLADYPEARERVAAALVAAPLDTTAMVR
jgi:hypothetical protein